MNNDDSDSSTSVSTPRPRATPGADVVKMMTPMFTFGAAMMRTQRQMFASLFGAPVDTQKNSGLPEVDEPEAGETSQAELDQMIAVRAEQISHGSAGDQVENWLRAEREVLAERSSSSA